MSEHSISAPVVYKAVPGFPGYRVGDDGTVWTIKAKGGNSRLAGRALPAWRLMKVWKDDRGYLRVNLDLDGKTCSRFIHRLVLEAFVGPRPNGMEACHYPDLDKSNNTLRNLRWDTHAENERDEYRDRPPVESKVCKRCGQAKKASDFYKDKRASDGLKTECKACHSLTAVETRDPEKKRAANKEYMRRARARGRQ